MEIFAAEFEPPDTYRPTFHCSRKGIWNIADKIGAVLGGFCGCWCSLSTVYNIICFPERPRYPNLSQTINTVLLPFYYTVNSVT